MIYRLPVHPSRELAANLACLQDCVSENAVFHRDLAKRRALEAKLAATSPICCAPKPKSGRPAQRART